LDPDPFNGHFVDLMHSKYIQILGVVNLDDYTYLMVMEGSNYRRKKNNSKTGNTFVVTASVTNFAVDVPATSVVSKRYVDTFYEVPNHSVKSAPKERDKKFNSHVRNQHPTMEFQIMVKNKLNIIMNDLMGIKHDLHVLKCTRFQADENNGVGSISSSSSGHNVYISEYEETGDA
jgi:hypothetical protein